MICISQIWKRWCGSCIKGGMYRRRKCYRTGPCLFQGERRIYIVTEKTVCCCSHHFSQDGRNLLRADHQRPGIQEYRLGAKDIPLLYERVLKTLKPYSLMQQENVDLEEYKMELEEEDEE